MAVMEHLRLSCLVESREVWLDFYQMLLNREVRSGVLVANRGYLRFSGKDKG